MNHQTTAVSSKGQTVVPAHIRRQFSIKEGSVLSWEVRGGEIIIHLVSKSSQDDPFATFEEWTTEADEEAYADL